MSESRNLNFSNTGKQCLFMTLIFFLPGWIANLDLKANAELKQQRFLTVKICLHDILFFFSFQPSPRWLFVPILLRFLFIPFFLLCNYRPSGIERLWPVLIHWDWAYWVGGMLLGLTSGYFSSMAMMFCPR